MTLLPETLFLVLHVLHQPLGADLAAVDVAHRVGGDALGRAGAGCLLDRIGNERRHLAGSGTADPDAALPAVVVSGNGLRFRIGNVNVVVLVDEHAARPAELAPLIEEI